MASSFLVMKPLLLLLLLLLLYVSGGRPIVTSEPNAVDDHSKYTKLNPNIGHENAGSSGAVVEACLPKSRFRPTSAFRAGGLETETCKTILNSAEKYNPETNSWERLPDMKRRRKLCSGCYMDNRFYGMGGVGENHRELKRGEYYDQSGRCGN
ncbi:hypothetical protein K1719_004540 [Acacia pycnantha]|nr:hypothetical protein K1719_004540 [Acacia pycnantha]